MYIDIHICMCIYKYITCIHIEKYIFCWIPELSLYPMERLTLLSQPYWRLSWGPQLCSSNNMSAVQLEWHWSLPGSYLPHLKSTCLKFMNTDFMESQGNGGGRRSCLRRWVNLVADITFLPFLWSCNLWVFILVVAPSGTENQAWNFISWKPAGMRLWWGPGSDFGEVESGICKRLQLSGISAHQAQARSSPGPMLERMRKPEHRLWVEDRRL